VFRPSLVDIWADADPTPLPRPAAASVDRARPVAASVDAGRMSLPYASIYVDVRWPGSTAGPSLLEPATSAFAGVPSAAQVTLMLRRCVHVCARIPRCRQAM